MKKKIFIFKLLLDKEESNSLPLENTGGRGEKGPRAYARASFCFSAVNFLQGVRGVANIPCCFAAFACEAYGGKESPAWEPAR